MNRVEIAGIVSDAAPVRFIGRGVPVLDFTLALTDARWNPDTGQHEPVNTFVRCHAYGTQVEVVEDTGGIGKGDAVHVVGRLSQRPRVMADGKTERKTHVDALVVTVLTRKSRPPQTRPASVGSAGGPPAAPPAAPPAVPDDPWAGG